MFKKKFYQLLIIIIITSCSSAPKESTTKTKFVPDIEGYKFVGITKIEDYLEQNNYQNMGQQSLDISELILDN